MLVLRYLTKDENDWLVMEALHGMLLIPHKTVVSISGGKDSTATYLRAMELGVPFLPVFADVDNEFDETYDYVRNLHHITGGPEVQFVQADLSDKFERKRKTIREKWPEQGVSNEVVERALVVMKPSGNRFLDLSLLRSGFPGTERRFCTQELKIKPIQKQVQEPIYKAGYSVFSWQGIRAEESPARRGKKIFQYHHKSKNTPYPYYSLLPILWWSIADVWAQHKRHNIKPNPLYFQGYNRVGCRLCIMSTKKDIRLVSQQAPGVIEILREWEFLVGQASKKDTPYATFFPVRSRRRKIDPALITTDQHGIDDAVEWSKTTHGGKIYDLFAIGAKPCNEEGYCE